jgi:HlyD family secretion protein
MRTLLPAAVEFQTEARQIGEQRPPWILGATLYTLLAVILSAIAWAALARVDRIVVAPGKLVTTANTIVLQPLETSVVRSLKAVIGDIVRKGEPLASLDPTFTEADSAQLSQKVASLTAEIERLESMLDDRPYVPYVLDEEARLQTVIWKRSSEQHRAKLASFDQQTRHAQAQITTKDADHAALALRLFIVRELEGMRAQLFEREAGSKINYLEAKAQRLQVERDMQLNANTRAELEQEAMRFRTDMEAYIAEYRRKLGENLVEARRERDTAQKQLEKAARRNAITVLTAPTDAIVLDVAQRSVGSVLKEAEPLYTLVPLDSPLEAEVLVEGRDVGHVATGALSRLKLEAWPFQKHGTVAGEVRTISADSFSPDGKREAQQHPYYRARIQVTSAELRDVPSNFRLIPGMAVTAEIKAGERTVFSYILYPLLRGFDEGIREP